MTAKLFSRKHKSGQAMLLLVLIALVASLGLALSVANRSNLQQRGSAYNVQGEQAYSAAESGLEAMLDYFSGNNPNCNNPQSQSLSNSIGNGQYSVNFTCVGGSNTGDVTTAEFTLAKDTPEIFHLDKKVKNVIVNWGNQGSSEPAMEISLYDTTSPYSYEERSYYWNESGTSNLERPQWSNNKSEVDLGTDFKVSINNQSLLQLTARYADAQKVTVKFLRATGKKVPLQGYLITSEGTAGASKRTIVAFYRPADIGNVVNNILYTSKFGGSKTLPPPAAPSGP